MASQLNLADFRGYTDHQIDPDAISEEINRLQDDRAAYEANGETMQGEDAALLEMLLRFRGDVERLSGGQFYEAVMVPDDRFELYLRSVVEQEHGIDADCDIDAFIDWPGLVKRRQGLEFKAAWLNNQQVWVQPS